MIFLHRHVVVVALFTATVIGICAYGSETEEGKVLIKAVNGSVTIQHNDTRSAAISGDFVSAGAIIETGANSSVDFILKYNGSALRLPANSRLQVNKLVKQEGGTDLFTETNLRLLSGSLIGSQRKLNGPSRLEIQFPNGIARIKGTEYIVRADGAVTVLSGVVSVNYNLPGNGGSVRVTISAGQSFNPATGQVVTTTADYLINTVADVDTVRNNAQVFKAGGATVVVKPDLTMSPSKGNNGVGNGIDPQPPGNPPVNDGPGTGPGNPGNGNGNAGGNGNGNAKGK